MKQYLLFPIMLLTCVGCQTTSPGNVSHSGLLSEINAPPSIEFQGDVYQAGYSASSAKQSIVEYFLPGEGPRSWRKMFALRLDPNGGTSIEQVRAMQAMLIEGGNRSVRAYKSVEGHGIEFIITERGRQEFSVFRYVDRTNGTVSLQYAENLPVKKLRAMEATENVQFYVTLRSNVVWGLEALKVPHIERSP